MVRISLKVAIWEAGKSQRRVAAEARIPENRLSEIVCGWVTPTTDEQQKIASALGKTVDALFPAEA